MFQQYHPVRALRCAAVALFLALALEAIGKIVFGDSSALPSYMALLYGCAFFMPMSASLWYANFRGGFSLSAVDLENGCVYVVNLSLKQVANI